MLDLPDQDVPAEPFAREVLDRLPLAEAVLSLWAYVLRPDFLTRVFERHRGRSFEDLLTFPVFVELIADALIRHHGSGRQSFVRAREREALPTTPRAVYGKLARVPLSLSLGFLEEVTATLAGLLPEATVTTTLPASLDAMTVVILDGKKIKKAAKRLKPLRATPGRVFGGKLLVAYVPRRGMAVAMAADPDGEANDIKLMPQVLPRARARIAGPRLWVADRQFCDLEQPRRLTEEGDHFLIRFSLKLGFHPDPTRPSVTRRDRRGRTVIEDEGWIGAATDRRRRRVRRLTLVRPADEDVILITDLVDAAAYPAEDLLEVYLARWGIERVFQQITEVFDLKHLIGSTPQATVFQASFCLVLYNLIEVVRAWIAGTRPEPTAVVSLSSEQIFTDVRDELTALNKVVAPAQVAASVPRTMTPAGIQERLRQLLGGAWSPLWIKAVNQKPRPAQVKAKASGAHTSVHKVLQAHREKPVLAARRA
jgi:hypothetical protein